VTVKTTKSELVYDRIRKQIIGGSLEPGAKLSATALSRKFGVARNVVRESLVRLKSEGFVRNDGAYSGTYVEEIDLPKVIEHYEVRQSVEGMAARLAAKNMNAYQVAELRRLGKAANKAFEDYEASGEERLDANLAFHHYLLANCGNSLLLKMYQMHHLSPVSLSHFQQSAGVAIGKVPGESYADYYDSLCDAIGSRKPDEAESCARERIEVVTEQMRSFMWAHSKSPGA